MADAKKQKHIPAWFTQPNKKALQLKAQEKGLQSCHTTLRVTLSRLLTRSEPQFPHLQSNKNIHPSEPVKEISEMVAHKTPSRVTANGLQIWLPCPTSIPIIKPAWFLQILIGIIAQKIWGMLALCRVKQLTEGPAGSQSPTNSNPWRRKWQPTPVFLPGKSHGWRNLVGYHPWGCKESDTTEQLHSLHSLIFS